ncbi:potassium transporter Kup [Comamonadaceae bacterium SL12-8]|uniref:Potassium transporter Kup n=2 Tax=Amphibiibacter pelophylacis TaxID=1799477 RepID=A0ACC6P4Z7_9BURK
MQKKTSLAALTLAALGVVYGDIGTSPLYAVKEVFLLGHVPIDHDSIMGVLSLMFWALTLVVSLKYVLLVLRADNHGEGGVIALLALALSAVGDRVGLRARVALLGLFGTAIFFGDGVITPAISVLSAVEGLSLIAPSMDRLVLPVSLAVLTALFAVQRLGTARVGRAFGPVTLVWFVAIALVALPHIASNPHVLLAVNPWYALHFFAQHGFVAFVVLGAVVLCVTGGEALYADMGHFGAKPIRIAWYGLVMPALLINYFGQGALLLANPKAAENPFYLMVPQWALWPMVILATMATVIASQALISALFSVVKQAIQLGYLPRMHILHTSVRDTGQIYVPVVNWGLYAAVVFAVLMFGSSGKLAAAYGIAVTVNMSITTILTFFVIRYAWKLNPVLCVAATAFFLVIDLAFLGANLLKVIDGGWFPLVIGAVMFMLISTWQRGRALVRQHLRDDALNLSEFLDGVFYSPPARVPGTAVFLTPDVGMTPNALLHNLKHNKVLHEYNLFVTARTHEVPWIGFQKRVEIEQLGHDCWQVILNFGFKNDPDVPEALSQLTSRGVPLDEMDTSYFLSRDSVMPTVGSGMSAWREKLFASMHRNAADTADFLGLPANRVVELGSKVEI